MCENVAFSLLKNVFENQKLYVQTLTDQTVQSEGVDITSKMHYWSSNSIKRVLQPQTCPIPDSNQTVHSRSPYFSDGGMIAVEVVADQL